MINRRSLITCTCCSLAVAAYPANAQPLPVAGGCDTPDSAAQSALQSLAGQPDSSTVSVSFTSGDERLDRAFGELISDLASRFQVRPAFVFYDDSAAANAITVSTTYYKGTHGTVLFGKTLLAAGLVNKDFGDLFIESVCAHEFGHVVQNTASYKDRLMKQQSTEKIGLF